MINTVLVISRYNEDISWIQNVNIPYIIYNKGLNLDINCINISNIGKEEYTYLTYIVDNYDHLPERVIFTQGNPFDHSPDFLRLLNNIKYFSEVQPLSFYYNRFVPGLQFNILSKPIFINGCRIHVDFFDEKLRRFYHPAKKFFYAPGGSFYNKPIIRMQNTFYKFLKARTKLRTKMHKILGLECRKFLDLNMTPMCYGAIFSVTKEKIYTHPKSYYENLLKINTHMHNLDSKSFGWIMEYMWLELFGYNPPKSLLEI